MIRVAERYQLGLGTSEPHTCPCGKDVDVKGLHGLSCRRSSARQQRHTKLNDVIWRAIKRAQKPVAKKPVGLSRTDGKRPDGATLISWSRGKPLAWDVTVPDTFAESHLNDTAVLQQIRRQLSRPPNTCSICSYTNWNIESLEQRSHRDCAQIGKRITSITSDLNESNYLFQRVYSPLNGKVVSF